MTSTGSSFARALSTARQCALYSTLLFCCATVLKMNQHLQTVPVVVQVEQLPERTGPNRAARLVPEPEWTLPVPEQQSASSDNETSSVMIAVKTTQPLHATRLSLILDTWYNLLPESVYFFTDDASDEQLQRRTNGHLIGTQCAGSHNREALCCKMQAELQYYLTTEYSWFCHFDDDNYVNVPRLQQLLAGYDPDRPWYLGKPSTRHPVKIQDHRIQTLKFVHFWFATGGAGICLSRALVERMRPHIERNGFVQLGARIRLPDDVTLGFLSEQVLGVPLTRVDRFRSHLESMRQPFDIEQQVSLSYSLDSRRENVVSVPMAFSQADDPSHMRSVHCLLHPQANICPPPNASRQRR